VGSGAFDCLDYCCGGVEDCDSVCRQNVTTFVGRTREVVGFELDNVARAPRRPRPVPPRLVPMVFHGSSRERRFAPPAVALKLFSLFDRASGAPRYPNRTALDRAFCIASGTALVISSVEVDRPLERWWGLGPQKRRQVLDRLVEYGVAAITSPNYSLFSNTPRWDDLHSMKRIAICWQEMVEAGLPAALHLNARTAYDWRRWRDFIGERSEVNAVSFEFATCATDPARRLWYADQLARLAEEIRRPLTLIGRGGFNVLPFLAEAFADITLIDTTPFQKALKRQVAHTGRRGGLRWRSAAGSDASVQELLEHNYLESVAHLNRSCPQPSDRAGSPTPAQVTGP